MNIIRTKLSAELTSRNGLLESEIFDIIESKIRSQLSHLDRVLMLNTSWITAEQAGTTIGESGADFVVAMCLYNSLPADIYRAIVDSGVPHVIVGLASGPTCYRISFSAIANPRYFERYTVEELELLPDSRRFICLNRKPRPHRVRLVELLEESGLSELGYISLGDPKNPRVLPQTTTTLTNDESFINGAGIRNDIFSLGPLSVWNRSLLCLTTESEFDNEIQELHYTTEKTWKPIIGLRPFFIYGQPVLRDYLKDNGFDIFEDIFDYSVLHDRSTEKEYVEVAKQAILSIDDPAATYHRLLPRLMANKETFYRYSDNEYTRLMALNLQAYL